VRVYYEDTDAGGIVYYANYLRFFERARTEWLRSLELSSRAMAEQQGCQFVVREAQIAYRAPARLDDQLMLVLRPLRIRSASIQFRQWALDADTGDLLARADIGIACVRCDTGRPVALPQRLLNRVAR
jgi:acyl-CoA thioester hydrolase